MLGDHIFHLFSLISLEGSQAEISRTWVNTQLCNSEGPELKIQIQDSLSGK
jgi:hypothetical protein